MPVRSIRPWLVVAALAAWIAIAVAAGTFEGRVPLAAGPTIPPTSAIASVTGADSSRPATAELSQGDGAAHEDVELASRFLWFAANPTAESARAVPFDPDGVRLGLADVLGQPIPAAGLVDPVRWALDAEVFRAHVGPFSALDTLATRMPPEGALVNIGDHPHCASAPVPAPADVADLRRVSLQPVTPSSCLSWWTVDLFVTDSGEVTAVTLDLYEP